LIAGNLGWNTQFRASEKEPLTMTFKDYDGNGIVDPVFNYYVHGESYPAMPKDDITGQIPVLNKKYLDYNDYALATSASLFNPEQKKGEQKLEVHQQQTMILKNDKGKFSWQSLPIQAQFSCVYAMAVVDANGDGNKDLLLCGNNRHTRIKYGEYNANHGMLLMGNGKCNFSYMPQYLSGFIVKADVRSVVTIKDKIIFGCNNMQPVVYTK
jgi:hypothetical protein